MRGDPLEQNALSPYRTLAAEIREECGEEVCRCYQCLKCTAGCPLSFAMDYPPSQIIRLAQLGQEALILGSRTIWVCLTCYTCSVRCPNDIDIARVIDTLREKAVRSNHPAAKRNIALFHEYFLENVRKRGRTFESEFLARYQVKTGQVIKNAFLGLRMFLKGRMALMPDGVANRKEFQEIYRRIEERRGKR